MIRLFTFSALLALAKHELLIIIVTVANVAEASSVSAAKLQSADKDAGAH